MNLLQFATNNNVNAVNVTTEDLGLVCSLQAEAYEGMLVKINNAEIMSIDEYGNWTVNDGSGSTLVDDYFFDGDWPEVSAGDTFDITGVVEYSYNEYKILPRFFSDIPSAGGCGF